MYLKNGIEVDDTSEGKDCALVITDYHAAEVRTSEINTNEGIDGGRSKTSRKGW